MFEAERGVPIRFAKPKDDPLLVTQRSETKLGSLTFTVHKFRHRPKPSKRQILLICCFSEFGCETLGALYCIPRVLKRHRGYYVIVVGWYGREYLYRHLVDEYWELKEEFMWLRDYSRAFHHVSDNLKRAEEELGNYGTALPSAALGKFLVGNYCRTCGQFWGDWINYAEGCPNCKSTVINRSFLTDTAAIRKTACRIPAPSSEKMAWAKGLFSGPTVGIFARSRKTYGRNLSSEFYVKLISLLKEMGYGVIWLGEKHNTLPCPVSDVVDFSRDPTSRDLERTLAIVKQLEFTVQFWTASTRLSGLVGTPYILFESPEQIYSSGLNPAQEGRRLELTSFGPKKVIISHYFNVLNNQDEALRLVEQGIKELKAGDYQDMMGLIEGPEVFDWLKSQFYATLH